MKYIIGNWKMNGSKDMAWKLSLDLHQFLVSNPSNVAKMVICPPFPYLPVTDDFLSRHESKLALGGQDCSDKDAGAFTGDIAASMLRDAGCTYVIVGHSERRQYHREQDSVIAQKIIAAQKAGLVAVLCVGETKEQREDGKTMAILSIQLKGCLIGGIDPKNLIVAYEPVWAIGTGLNATNDDIKSAHAHIRQDLKTIFGPDGEKVAILYGGSVKGSNAKEIMATPGVDGVLVGGASLKAEEFTAIYQAA